MVRRMLLSGCLPPTHSGLKGLAVLQARPQLDLNQDSVRKVGNKGPLTSHWTFHCAFSLGRNDGFISSMPPLPVDRT